MSDDEDPAVLGPRVAATMWVGKEDARMAVYEQGGVRRETATRNPAYRQHEALNVPITYALPSDAYALMKPDGVAPNGLGRMTPLSDRVGKITEVAAHVQQGDSAVSVLWDAVPPANTDQRPLAHSRYHATLRGCDVHATRNKTDVDGIQAPVDRAHNATAFAQAATRGTHARMMRDTAYNRDGDMPGGFREMPERAAGYVGYQNAVPYENLTTVLPRTMRNENASTGNVVLGAGTVGDVERMHNRARDRDAPQHRPAHPTAQGRAERDQGYQNSGATDARLPQRATTQHAVNISRGAAADASTVRSTPVLTGNKTVDARVATHTGEALHGARVARAETFRGQKTIVEGHVPMPSAPAVGERVDVRPALSGNKSVGPKPTMVQAGERCGPSRVAPAPETNGNSHRDNKHAYATASTVRIDSMPPLPTSASVHTKRTREQSDALYAPQENANARPDGDREATSRLRPRDQNNWASVATPLSSREGVVPMKHEVVGHEDSRPVQRPAAVAMDHGPGRSNAAAPASRSHGGVALFESKGGRDRLHEERGAVGKVNVFSSSEAHSAALAQRPSFSSARAHGQPRIMPVVRFPVPTAMG